MAITVFELPTLNCGGGGIIVWGHISMEARIELMFVNRGILSKG